MSQRRQRAVVCGASMGGLLAARVLADVYGAVTVVERDVLPEKAVQRRGVSQGRHLHVLLSRGSSTLAEFFPGLFDELIASGANVIDGTDASVMCMQVGAHQLRRSGSFVDPEALVTHLASRPLLEAHVRRRVSALRNVAFLEGHDVVGPVIGDTDRVTALRRRPGRLRLPHRRIHDRRGPGAGGAKAQRAVSVSRIAASGMMPR